VRLVITGCEYAGKTTLLKQITEWWKKMTGIDYGGLMGHDHFTFYGGGSQMHPPPGQEDIPEEELEKVKSLGPVVREQLQRYVIDYHLGIEWTKYPDWIVVGFHIEEAVYAPLYYGYGYPGQYGDREQIARHIDRIIMQYFPGTVLVLVKASSETIAKRMKENPHPDNVIKEEDIEFLLKRFDEEYYKSLIYPKFVLDTTDKTPKETLNEFVKSMTPYFSNDDIQRILLCQKLKKLQGDKDEETE